jgi:hypothetical protein
MFSFFEDMMDGIYFAIDVFIETVNDIVDSLFQW